MPLTEEDERAIDEALQAWRQGDVSLDAGLEFLHLADLSRPHSTASTQVAEAMANDGEPIEDGPAPVLDEARGMVMLGQTCDVVRNCRSRPFVEVAPLIEVSEEWVEAIHRLKRPAFAYVPAVAGDRLVADLDRTMTVEKALVARWTRTPGWETDEGAHLRALREIRVRAAPSWDDAEVQLSWWFIKDADPADAEADWPTHMDQWLALFDQTGRFRLDPPTACRLRT